MEEIQRLDQFIQNNENWISSVHEDEITESLLQIQAKLFQEILDPLQLLVIYIVNLMDKQRQLKTEITEMTKNRTFLFNNLSKLKSNAYDSIDLDNHGINIYPEYIEKVKNKENLPVSQELIDFLDEEEKMESLHSYIRTKQNKLESVTQKLLLSQRLLRGMELVKSYYEQKNIELTNGITYLQKQGIQFLYYLTHVDTIGSITEQGILSREAANKQNLLNDQGDISNQSVQESRKRNNADIHKYVPLYFSNLTPMYYVVKKRFGIQNLVIIKISLSILTNIGIDGGKFSNMNCANLGVTLYSNIKELQTLNWGIITGKEMWDENTKAYKSAEVLIKEKIDPTYFDGIVVHSSNKKIQGLKITHEIDDKLF